MDPDDELMCRLQGGDETAFEELVSRHYHGLRNFFRVRSSTVRARGVADDLAQEVLLRIYNEAWDFIPQGKFKAWMYRIARNLLIAVQRRESYDALIGAREGGDGEAQLARLVSDSAAVVDLADTKELGDLVAELLAELPEEQRLTFQTHHFLGLSLPEVAEVM
ncbi:MAG: sigma-70 family RNA polymerase sigma factor, partial [Planctomycetales bacterium]